jgi:hypothetical protein
MRTPRNLAAVQWPSIMPPPQARWLAQMSENDVLDAIVWRTRNRAVLEIISGERSGTIKVEGPMPIACRKRRDSPDPATLPALKVRLTPHDGRAWVALVFYRGRELEVQLRRVALAPCAPTVSGSGILR